MSVFDKVLSSLGIGAAQIDTQLQSVAVHPGETLQGQTLIRGGKVAQEVQRLYAYLMITYRTDNGIAHASIASASIAEPFVIQPGETRTYPFAMQIPYGAPVSLGRSSGIYLKTGLDVPMAIDPGDTDHLTIRPHPWMQAVVSAAEQLGFYLYSSESSYHPHIAHRFGSTVPYVQEFEFKPSGSRRHTIQEIELSFFPSASGLEVLVEVDKRVRGFGGMLAEGWDLNERRAVLRVTEADVRGGQLTAKLDGLIRQLAGH